MREAKTKAGKKVNCQLPGAELLAEGKSVAEVMAELDKPKHPGGRPRKFTSPDDMQSAINNYFESCWQEIEIEKGEGENKTITRIKKQTRPYTVMGLALALDMCRDTLCEYAKNGQFSDIVKKAKAIVEEDWEVRLAGGNSTGSIFWLKNHAGYVDKQVNEHMGKISLESLVTGNGKAE